MEAFLVLWLNARGERALDCTLALCQQRLYFDGFLRWIWHGNRNPGRILTWTDVLDVEMGLDFGSDFVCPKNLTPRRFLNVGGGISSANVAILHEIGRWTFFHFISNLISRNLSERLAEFWEKTLTQPHAPVRRPNGADEWIGLVVLCLFHVWNLFVQRM